MSLARCASERITALPTTPVGSWRRFYASSLLRGTSRKPPKKRKKRKNKKTGKKFLQAQAVPIQQSEPSLWRTEGASGEGLEWPWSWIP
ncbi:hypothetical protein VUR80DRAFT_7954 [Thermomyces stellatus]